MTNAHCPGSMGKSFSHTYLFQLIMSHIVKNWWGVNLHYTEILKTNYIQELTDSKSHGGNECNTHKYMPHFASSQQAPTKYLHKTIKMYNIIDVYLSKTQTSPHQSRSLTDQRLQLSLYKGNHMFMFISCQHNCM